MAKIDNLDQNEMKAFTGRAKAVEVMAPLGSSAVSGGRTRFIGNESLLVEGSQKVSGWLIVTGTLKVVGTFLLDGITTITGALTAKGATRFEGDTTQVGPHHVQGNQDITGTLAVKGETTLEALVTLLNNLAITAGGKITVGSITISPVSSGGIAGSIGSSTTLVLDAPHVLVKNNSTLNGNVMVAGTITNAFMPGGTGVPVYLDTFGQLVHG
jgi:hypothetical protein